MSTGDQSQYIRSKLAERGSRPGARFMRDGFDEWAESETPARMGQMEKEPAEHTMEGQGGAMTLARAKKFHNEMHGGDLLEDATRVAKAAVEEARKLIAFWRNVSNFIDEFSEDLQDEIIDNEKSSPSVKEFAGQLLKLIKSLKGYQTILDQVAAAASSIGLGRHGGRKLHGGAMSIQDIGKVAGDIAQMYFWLKNNVKNLKAVLALRSLNPPSNPIGKKILDFLNPIFGAVGMGSRHGGMKHSRSSSQMSDHCRCHHGGASLMKSPGKALGSQGQIGMMTGTHDAEYMDAKLGGRRHGGASLMKSPGKALGSQGQIGMMTGTHDAEYMDAKLGGRRRMPKAAPSDEHNAMLGGRRHGGATTSEFLRKLQEGAPLESIGLGGRRHGGAYKVPAKIGMMPGTGNVGEMHELKMGGRRRVGGRAPSARGEIVKKVMREHGLALGAASKYVKEHGLY